MRHILSFIDEFSIRVGGLERQHHPDGRQKESTLGAGAVRRAAGQRPARRAVRRTAAPASSAVSTIRASQYDSFDAPLLLVRGITVEQVDQDVRIDELQLSAHATRRESISRRLVRPGWSVTGEAGFPADGSAVSFLHTTPGISEGPRSPKCFLQVPHPCPFEDLVFHRDGQVHGVRSCPNTAISITRNPCSWTNGRGQYRRTRCRPGQNTARARLVRSRPARPVDGYAKTHVSGEQRHARPTPRRVRSAPGTAAKPRFPRSRGNGAG